MRVFEMKPCEVGNAVENDDAIIVTLSDGRVIIVAKKDMVMKGTRIESIRKMSYNKDIVAGHTLEKKKKKTKKQSDDLKHLSVKEDARLGLSLNDSLALNVYKRYGHRLWNNVMADVMSRVNSAKETAFDNTWFVEMLKSVYSKYDLRYSQGQHNAIMMWLKGTGLVSSKRRQDKHMVYTIHRKPEIQKTVET